MEIVRQKVLILDYCDLPENVQKVIKGWYDVLVNDIILPIRSGFDVESWSKGFSEIESYWNDQKKYNKYKGSLQEFIKDYGLEFDIWFIEQNFDLKDIDRVLINFCY